MRKLLVVAVLALAARPVAACLWDRDTLAMESARFPDVLELITGKFARHSNEFYRWRIDDRQKKLAANPNTPALLDDLAVAYDKLGDHAAAIALMRRKDELTPGLYETYANWGTFLFHQGELGAGLPYINKAIAVNAQAHFGREAVQRDLVEYVLARREAHGTTVPVMPVGERNLFSYEESSEADPARPGFFAFALEKAGIPRSAWASRDRHDAMEKVRREQLAGVMGMMRFGDHTSPILLEALGDLLSYADPFDVKSDAKLMAARAYLKAAAAVDGRPRDDYRLLARKILALHEKLSVEEVEIALAKEQRAADAWYATVRADEARWISAGDDVELLFEQKYFPPQGPR